MTGKTQRSAHPLPRRCLTGTAFAPWVAAAVALFWPAGAGAQWVFHGVVAEGNQIDAVRGPNDVIHLVSSRYYQFDANGNQLADEDQGDGRQGMMDFPPAIAVGTDGTVHIVTRHDGDWTAGHDIRYRRRNGSGVWDEDYLFGSRVGRNYVVGAAWAGGNVYMFYTEVGTNVWGDVHFFQAGSGSAAYLGAIAGIWRADADARMRGYSGRVFMGSGEPDPDGTVYFLNADAGANLHTDLDASQQTHTAGTGRRGFPDLYVDASSNIHFTYGAQYTIYYNRYNAQGQPAFASDVLVLDNLGDWHMSTGLSAVAGSDDGNTVVVVGLRSDGSQGASDSDLLWSRSSDGGQSFTAEQDLGRNTDGGEGRHRPRLVAIGSRFFLFYTENGVSGISLATLDALPDTDNDGYTSDVDCDDGNPDVNPGATETCNGIDDNCDGNTDEGCGTDGGTSPDGGPGSDGSTGPDSGTPVQDSGPDPGTDGGSPFAGAAGGCSCRSVPARTRTAPGTLPMALVLLSALLAALGVRLVLRSRS